MCEMLVLNAYEGLGQGTALNVARDEVRHIQRGMAASLELVLLASAEWADPMKGQNGTLLSDIQEPLEEAPRVEQVPLVPPDFSTPTSFRPVLKTSPTVDGGLSQMFSCCLWGM